MLNRVINVEGLGDRTIELELNVKYSTGAEMVEE